MEGVLEGSAKIDLNKLQELDMANESISAECGGQCGCFYSLRVFPSDCQPERAEMVQYHPALLFLKSFH